MAGHATTSSTFMPGDEKKGAVPFSPAGKGGCPLFQMTSRLRAGDSIPRMISRRMVAIALVAAAGAVVTAQQQPPAPPPAWVAVKPIDPPATGLPAEAATAG